MKNKKLRLGVLLVLTALWIGFIFRSSLQTNAVSARESGRILRLLQGPFPGVTDYIIRKLAHFTEFFILGLLLWFDWKLLSGKWGFLPPTVGLCIAAIDEGIQTCVPGRSGQISDVLLDFFGVTAACLILTLLHTLRKRKQDKARRT